MRLLLAPALGVLAIFAVALGALFQYSVVAFIPGSLQTGELTLANGVCLGGGHRGLGGYVLTARLSRFDALDLAQDLERRRQDRQRGEGLVATMRKRFADDDDPTTAD